MGESERVHPDFADLWPTSRGRIDAALAAVERGVAALEERALGEDQLVEARAAAHKLVGTLGTYGLTATADVARELEDAFAGRSAADPAQLRARLDAIVRAVEAAA